MKQIFIIQGDEAVGKSELFNNALKADIIINPFESPIFIKKYIKNSIPKIRSMLIDDFIVNDEKCKKLARDIDFYFSDVLEYLIIITNCNVDDLYKLTKRLEVLDIPISLCKMEKGGSNDFKNN